MTPTLSFEQTLLYYDAPQVILLRDGLSRPFIGFLLDSSGEDLPYIVAPLHPDDYSAVVGGRSTYWEAINRSKDFPSLHVAAVGHDLQQIAVKGTVPFEEVPRDSWPAEEAMHFPEESFEFSLAQSYSKQAPVLLELAFDPQGSGLTIGRFSSLLTRLHQLVKALAGVVNVNRQFLNIAVPAHSGSFKVLLEQAEDLGRLFPDSSLTKALQYSTELIGAVDDPDVLSTYFQGNPDAAPAFKEFIQAVKSVGSGVGLRWEAGDVGTGNASASRYSIVRLDTWLKDKYDRQEAIVSYGGTFEAMDLHSGTWRLSDTEVVSGTPPSDGLPEVRGKTSKRLRHLLRDLVSGGTYVFKCSELVTLDPLTSEPLVERELIEVHQVSTEGG